MDVMHFIEWFSQDSKKCYLRNASHYKVNADLHSFNVCTKKLANLILIWTTQNLQKSTVCGCHHDSHG
jgi:hypothetical protein